MEPDRSAGRAASHAGLRGHPRAAVQPVDLARQHRSIRYGQLRSGLAVPVPLDLETRQRSLSGVFAELAGRSHSESVLDHQPAGSVEGAVYAPLLTVAY